MKHLLCALLCTIVLFIFTGCPDPNPGPGFSLPSEVPQDGDVGSSSLTTNEDLVSHGRIVVANRGAGTISVINTTLNEPVATYELPAGALTPEPMYVVWARGTNRIFVGDRANNRLVVFRGDDLSVETTVPAGEGVFHMWMNAAETQLWVVNDIEKSATVIDPVSLLNLGTVPMPGDLVARGGIPHDVAVEPRGRFAYVTMIGASLDSHYVVQFRTGDFAEVNRAVVGRDAHVSLTPHDNNLYLPCQGSSVVEVLERKSLERVTTLSIPSAHGAGMPRSGRTFYTTNFGGLGIDGIYAIDLTTHTILGSTDTPHPVPHNIVLTPDGEMMFVTHSGTAASWVTVYTTNGGGVPTYLTTIDVGLNPFGLAFLR
jgi:DNA-binding beta-propeller fold protein YncE